jgi:acyl-CoA thioester hydrolase
VNAPESRRFVHPVRVRPLDCDRQGIVGHPRYLHFFEGAFIEFWRHAVGPFTDLVEAGVDIAVADVSMRYFAPTRFDDVLDVAVVLTGLGESSLRMRFDGRVRGGLAVRCEIGYASVATASGKRAAIPEPVTRVLGEWLHAR